MRLTDMPTSVYGWLCAMMHQHAQVKMQPKLTVPSNGCPVWHHSTSHTLQSHILTGYYDNASAEQMHRAGHGMFYSRSAHLYTLSANAAHSTVTICCETV